MRSKLSYVVEVAGAAAMLVGFVLGARHLRVELPLLIGAGTVLVGRYLVK